jgi:hypothetical protein
VAFVELCSTPAACATLHAWFWMKGPKGSEFEPDFSSECGFIIFFATELEAGTEHK